MSVTNWPYRPIRATLFTHTVVKSRARSTKDSAMHSDSFHCIPYYAPINKIHLTGIPVHFILMVYKLSSTANCITRENLTLHELITGGDIPEWPEFIPEWLKEYRTFISRTGRTVSRRTVNETRMLGENYKTITSRDIFFEFNPKT